MNDLNLSMFRAYDIRTPSAALTDDLARRLARAEAVYFRDTLGVPGVLLAHDARITGPRYLEIASEEFLRAGLDVIAVPAVCSTSMFYFVTMRQPELAGVMYGASHNPAGDTGQKILGPGVRPIAHRIGPQHGLDRIEELYVHGVGPALTPARGRITAYDPTQEYLEYSMKLAGVGPGDMRGLRLFQDYLHGAAGREMMLAFGAAGADLTPAHFAADGSFPLGAPNPVKPEVIRDGLQILADGDFLLGTFFDGDGDRVDFYRGDGAYLSSSFVYAGILPELRQRFTAPGLGVYVDLKCSPLAIVEMARSGVRASIIRNGHSQIKHAMFENPAMFGAVEESGHFYEAFAVGGERFCSENTLYFTLLAARVWRAAPARFADLFDLQARTAREREWGYKFPSDDQRARALDAVQAHFAEKGARAMSRTATGYDLEATIMRRGVPFDIDAHTVVAPDWLQVCQRVSQSENGLARWEVVAADAGIAAEAKTRIARIAQEFGAGDEYQG